MNERDSEQVAHSLIARGYERVAHETEADVVLLNTCSVRDMADQKALGKMGMLGRMAKERPHMVFGFLGCMAQARGESLLKNLPHVDLVVGTQKFHRVADYVEELVASKSGTLAIAPATNRCDGRFTFFDCRHCGGTRLAIDDSRSTAGAKAGHGVRLHHAGMQHALHLLHRPADARRGAQPFYRRDREGSARSGRAWCEGSHVARANRKSVWSSRISEARWQKSLCAVTGSGE